MGLFWKEKTVSYNWRNTVWVLRFTLNSVVTLPGHHSYIITSNQIAQMSWCQLDIMTCKQLLSTSRWRQLLQQDLSAYRIACLPAPCPPHRKPFNPIALRKAKIVYNCGLSECNRVKENFNILLTLPLLPRLPSMHGVVQCTFLQVSYNDSFKKNSCKSKYFKAWKIPQKKNKNLI